jgi:hypothetical protein
LLLWVIVRWGSGWREEKVAREKDRDVGDGLNRKGDVEAVGDMLGRSEDKRVGKS